jgi:hypothetical protein
MDAVNALVGGRPTMVAAPKQGAALPAGRPPADQRHFVSPAVDKTIADFSQRMVTLIFILLLIISYLILSFLTVPRRWVQVDKDLATLFSNCLPNTLDTTVFFTNDSSTITKKKYSTSFHPTLRVRCVRCVVCGVRCVRCVRCVNCLSIARIDTFVVTGDIDAMWLRDSTNQVTHSTTTTTPTTIYACTIPLPSWAPTEVECVTSAEERRIASRRSVHS